jgi:uncharacterized protein
VIAVDTNVLVYAHRREPAEHERASELLRELAEGTEPWAVPWPVIRLLAEPFDFPAQLAEFARRPRVRGPVIHDARVAAICVAHGVERLLTRDRDFALFPELVTDDPF